MRRWILIPVAAAATAVLLYAVTLNGSLQVLGTLTASIVDFTGAASTAPMKSGTALPGSCAVGQAFFRTDAAPGQNIHLCTAANTWTPVQGSAGGGFDWKPSTRYVTAVSDFLQLGGSYSSPVPAGGFTLYRPSGSRNLNDPFGPSPDGSRIGAATVATAATANDRQYWGARLNTDPFGSAAESLYGRSDLPWEFVVVFRLPQATDLANVEMLLGLAQNTTSDPPNSVGLRYRSAADTSFQFSIASNGAWGATEDTGVAPDTGWHRLRIRSDGSQPNKMWLRLDNGPEASVCPSGCTLTRAASGSELWNYFAFIVKTTDAVQKKLQVDYLHFWLDRGAER